MATTGNLITDLLAGLEKATEADLTALDAEIEAKEKAVESLRSLRKLIAQRLGLSEPARVSAATTHAETNGTFPAHGANLLGARRVKLLAELKARGPRSTQKLSELTGISKHGAGCLSQVLACDWFHVAPDGMVTLTDKGDRANPAA